ncbi:MAG: glycosyltransferase family 4 protein [Xenococcaceae cyanobacterium]
MKILLLNTSDLEGGAARAAFRLHKGLQKVGLESQMLVQSKISDDSAVISPNSSLEKEMMHLKTILEGLPLKFYPSRQRTNYSLQWLPDRISKKLAAIDPDIVNIHWINGGYLQIETIAKFKRPIVWTLHDMWAFTGGCHYTQDCDRYTFSCGACPQLNSKSDWDLSRWIWQRKAKAWQNLNLTIVTPSHWLAKCAGNSPLLAKSRIEVIPNGLNLNVYKPLDKSLAKNLLGLPQNKHIILFGALWATSDRRKGFHLLLPALQKLSQSPWQDNFHVVVFGASQSETPLDVNFPVQYLGVLHDDIALRLTYSAADLTIVPSTQEAFGQAASESLACGTPVVAFNSTGLQDIVEHQQNGYLAEPFEIEDLARGITWVIEDTQRYVRLCDRAREKAEREFNIELQASRYKTLFQEIKDSPH